MDPKAARPIIDALAQGLHPVTREVLPDESAFNLPTVILALHTASAALARLASDEALRKRSPAAPNTGKRWSPDDDQALGRAYAADPDLRRPHAGNGRYGIRTPPPSVGAGDAPP